MATHVLVSKLLALLLVFDKNLQFSKYIESDAIARLEIFS